VTACKLDLCLILDTIYMQLQSIKYKHEDA